MKFGNRRDRNVDVNLTPLIDVVFLLLIFFMVSTTFVRQNEIELSLPASDSSSAVERENKIEVSIDKNGIIYLENIALEKNSIEVMAKEFAKVLEAEHELSQPILIIKADSKARHQSVIDVMDAAQRVGLTRITFATINREAP